MPADHKQGYKEERTKALPSGQAAAICLRGISTIYCQWRSWRALPARKLQPVGGESSTLGVQLCCWMALLLPWTVGPRGRGFKRLPHWRWEMSHASILCWSCPWGRTRGKWTLHVHHCLHRCHVQRRWCCLQVWTDTKWCSYILGPASSETQWGEAVLSFSS